MVWRSWLPDWVLRPWQSVILGAALSLIATALRLAVQAPLGRELPFTFFFPALIVAAALGGYLGGITCLAFATVEALAILAPGASSVWATGAFLVAGGLVIAVAAALADSVRELRNSQAELTDAQAQLRTLVGELAHRNRNSLFVIMGIVSQSARGAQSAAEAERSIIERLEALRRAQDLIVESNKRSVSLALLLEGALNPFGHERFSIAPGPEVEIEPDLAMGLGLLFHELATNALKYGALSAADGRVAIAWNTDDAFARLSWRERGGPPPAAPTRQGFGSKLFEVALGPQGGRVKREFEPDGLVCELYIPRSAAEQASSTIPIGSALAERTYGVGTEPRRASGRE